MRATMSTYTIRLHGFWKYKADVFDENNNLVAIGELNRRNAQIEFLLDKERRLLSRHGFFRQWHQLMDETGNPFCHSLPKIGKYPLTLYTRAGMQWVKVYRQGVFNVRYIFYDAKGEEVAWMKTKGLFSRGYELRISQLQPDLRNNIISIATATVLFDRADAAAAAVAATSVSAAS